MAVMKVTCQWNEKMKFSATTPGLPGYKTEMDAKSPLGSDTAHTPKELVLAGICGCTAMDVVALLKKFKQPLEKLSVEAETELTEGYPAVFKEVQLVFKFSGPMDSQKVLESVMLSQTKYCGVSAMIAKAAPILYTVYLNDSKIGDGRAKF